mgnify:CR=1 FL=1
MIILYPDKRLRQKCQPVERFDREVEKTAKILEKELLVKDNGIGLAAPQIGRNQRIFALKDCFSSDNKLTIFVNPSIELHPEEKVYPTMINNEGKEEEFLEGCLSLPGLWGTVKRWLRIKISWQAPVDQKLVRREETITGLTAVAFQHELDHLGGILFIDRVKEEKGRLFKVGKDGKREEIDLKTDKRILDSR